MTINLYLSSFWTTCLAQTTIDEGVGRTKKSTHGFQLQIRCTPQQTGDSRFDSPAASISKGNALDWGSLRYFTDISDDFNALLALQQAEMFDVKEGTEQFKDISLLALEAVPAPWTSREYYGGICKM
jgi:hypothetical protein